jgi:DNA-binding protein H-NS
MARSANISAMSVDQLITLRGEIEAVLNSKVVEERRRLDSQLATLARVNGGAMKRGRFSKSGGSSLRGTVIAPKYRNPDNPSETWAGRGLKPRWLTAVLKKGKKLEHFALAAPAKTVEVKTRRGSARKAKS